MILPVGLVYDPAGKVVLDPDAGVQHAVRHLFATFVRTGSARAVVQTFNAEGLRFPAWAPKGATQKRAVLGTTSPLTCPQCLAQPLVDVDHDDLAGWPAKGEPAVGVSRTGARWTRCC